MRRRVALGVLVAMVASLFAGVAAWAQDEAGVDRPGDAPTLLRAVDNRVPEVGELELMHQGSPEGATLSQRGQEVPIDGITPLSEERGVNVVFVIDTGETMADAGGLNAARNGIEAVLDDFGPDDRVAIVEAGTIARTLQPLTSSTSRLRTIVTDDVAPSANGQAAVWGGMRLAAALLGADRSDRQPNVVLVTAGADLSDGDQRGTATSQLVNSLAGVFVLGWGGDFPADGFEATVARTGGAVRTDVGADDYAESIGTMTGWTTAQQYSIEFSPAITEAGQVVDSTLTIDGSSFDFTYVSGNLDQGPTALAPTESTGSTGVLGLSFLEGNTGQIVLVLFVLVAVAGTVYALGTIFGPDEGALSNVLQPYSEGFGTPDEADADDDAMAQTALLQRAVGFTEQMAERQGYLSRTEAALERADMPLRAGEALFFYVAMVALIGVAGLLLLPPMGALVLVLVAALVPVAVVSFKAGQRRRAFLSQLPDTLQLLAGTLRAGYSLMQGVEAVSQEVSEPMGKELRRVVTEARLGRPLEESLEGVAERMSSPDFAWAVMAIRIQREVGGNLSELLLTVADTMVGRERLRRDVQSLTAEGRVSAVVLGLLPIGLGVVMFLMNPTYMMRLFETGLGNVLLVLAIVSMGVGFMWMRQIIKIEV